MKNLMIIAEQSPSGRYKKEIHVCAWCSPGFTADLLPPNERVVDTFYGHGEAKKAGWRYATGWEVFGDNENHWVCPECAVDIMKYKREGQL